MSEVEEVPRQGAGGFDGFQQRGYAFTGDFEVVFKDAEGLDAAPLGFADERKMGEEAAAGAESGEAVERGDALAWEELDLAGGYFEPDHL